jgi:hypothetical protein
VYLHHVGADDGKHDYYALEVESANTFEECMQVYLKDTEHHERLSRKAVEQHFTV